MESVKNKKLSPDGVDFTPAASGGAEPSGFSVHPSLWETLERDPGLRSELDFRIAIRAKELAEPIAAEMVKSLADGTKANAVREAKGEARKQIEEAIGRVNDLCEGILNEKMRLLREHEREWCEALSHVMKRFLQPHRREILAGIEEWVDESLGVYASNHSIRVFVSPEAYSGLESSAKRGSRWEVLADSALKGSQVRCESAGAGVFFSPTEEWQKLDEMLDRVCKRERKEKAKSEGKNP